MDILKTLAPLAIKEATAYLSKRSSSPTTELAKAAAEGNVSAVKSILSQDHQIDLAPALVAAASAGKMEVLDILIDPPRRPKSENSRHKEKIKPTDVNVWSQHITPLIAAVQTHHVKTTDLLLDAGADTSLAPKGGETVLHIASRIGDLEMVKLLVEYEADLEARDGWGNTPLLSSARWGHPHTIKHLLAKGADIEAKDLKGSTALLLACRHDCVEAVKTLINSGANVGVRDKEGRGALHRAIAGVDFIEGIDAKVKEDIVRLLINAGADPRVRDKEGKRPTDMVGFLRGGDRVRRLLSPGSTPHSRGRTPAHSRHGSRTGSPYVDGSRHSHEVGGSYRRDRLGSPLAAGDMVDGYDRD
ncbi:hypothetical protein SBOR_4742 [Sclerotinia borealis F-4128]|uniref:Uncharacterized protein n=1 Tax=Sclerotinia borealis (strain F-4128) TaxID=1432307 RepID=W9CG90_SCLBF|nr:hypothetical protein SBOR_4742 [Sclerotinia borealis F-4128]